MFSLVGILHLDQNSKIEVPRWQSVRIELSERDCTHSLLFANAFYRYSTELQRTLTLQPFIFRPTVYILAAVPSRPLKHPLM